jgi:hypothetical protein
MRERGHVVAKVGKKNTVKKYACPLKRDGVYVSM